MSNPKAFIGTAGVSLRGKMIANRKKAARPLLILGTLLMINLMPVAGASSDEIPEQFQVWGKRAAAHRYLVDPGLDGPGSAEVKATAEEKARGFVVFAKPGSAIIKPDFAPVQSDRCKSLAAVDCRGLYGRLTFGVFALAGGDYSIAVTDLIGPDGAKIGAANFDVRAVRYIKSGGQVIPLLIETFDKKTVPTKRIQQFWVTYYIPDKATAGTYKGEIHILVNGRKKLTLPLALRVYSFDLVEHDVKSYIYYSNSTNRAQLGLVYKELVDQRCHGMNMGMVVPPVTGKGDLSREAMVPFLDAYKKAGFSKPYIHIGLWNRITAAWLNTPDKSIKMWGAWHRYYPLSRKLDQRYVKTVGMIEQECKKRGIKLILAVADEAGSHAWTIKATQHYNDLIKKRLPDVIRELTVGGGWAMNLDEHDLWRGRIHIWTTNRWLADKLAIVRRNDPKAKIQIYNMAGAGSAPGGVQSARNFYGFFVWKAGVNGAAQWVYRHGATPKHNYVWPGEAPNRGPVPTLRWEAVREGAKDLCYLATLHKFLGGKRDKTARQANRFLKEIADKIELRSDTYDPIHGGRIPAHRPGTYDQWRAKIADFIEKLTTK